MIPPTDQQAGSDGAPEKTDADVGRLGAALEELDVSNIFVYVGDAVRDDALPPEFRDRGTYVRTIASSTHSPASFASIVTGLYPPAHGVHSFSDRLPADVTRLFDLPDTESRFLNSIFAYATRAHDRGVDPIHSVLNTEPPSVDSPFEGMEPPFVAVERGPGGHAPYGDFTGTAMEYFEHRGGDRRAIADDYDRSIELDVKLFEQRVDELADRGLLDETLVVYTSDHGELLGEGGVLGHNDPMRPELVYVPTVFRHPNLPDETVLESSFHHADLMPTVLTAIGREVDPSQFDGAPAATALADDPRPCFWRNQFIPDWIPVVSGALDYEGVWDSGGGRVHTDTSRLDRYSVLAGKLLRSTKRSYMWRHLPESLRAYWPSNRTFGSPSFDVETARSVLQRAKENERTGRRTELSTDETERLRDLGYLN